MDVAVKINIQIKQHNELGLHLLPSSAAAQAAPTPFTAVVEQ